MTRSKKLRHDTLGTIEQLERRQTLSATPTVELLPGGLLKVTGTANAETITISRSDYDRSVLIARLGPPGRELGRWNIDAVTSIDASMGGGNDNLTIDFKDTGSLGSVRINMGTGSTEKATVLRTSLQTLDVNAKESINTKLSIDRSNIASRAFADFGSGQGNDDVTVWGSFVGKLQLSMGGGDDDVLLNRSTVNEANVNMGAGDRDKFETLQSGIASGLIDGGAGRNDAFRGPRFQGVRIVNFEDAPRS